VLLSLGTYPYWPLTRTAVLGEVVALALDKRVKSGTTGRESTP